MHKACLHFITTEVVVQATDYRKTLNINKTAEARFV